MNETAKPGPGRPKGIRIEDALATFIDISPTKDVYHRTVAELDGLGFELVGQETLSGGSIRLHFRRKKATKKGI